MDGGRAFDGGLDALLCLLHRRHGTRHVALEIGDVAFQLAHRLLLLSRSCLGSVRLGGCVAGSSLSLLNSLILLPERIAQFLDLALLAREFGLLRGDGVLQRLYVSCANRGSLFSCFLGGRIGLCNQSGG